MTRPLRSILVLGAALSAACATSRTLERPAEPVHVVIAHTTDLHGWIDGREEASTAPGIGQVRAGGLDVLAAYLTNLRAAHPGRVVVLDGGDEFQGTLASNLAEGEPVVLAFNAMGYSAGAIGNHEFDYGPLGEASVARSAGDDPLGALKRNIGLARYPMLAANVTEKATGRRPAWARPHLLLEIGEARIGIVGVITPDTPTVTTPANVEALAFGDPATAVVASARELRARGADAVVAVGHLGGVCRDVSNPEDVSSCEPGSEAFRMVRALPAGTIDAYFGGHTHWEVRHRVNGVPIVQPAPFGRGLGVLDLWVDTRAHRVLAERTTIRPHAMVCAKVYAGTQRCDPRNPPPGAAALEPAVFEGRAVEPDSAVAQLLKPYLDRVAAKRAEPLGFRVEARFTRDSARESSLGDLVAEAMRASVPGADVGITNSGGLRADLREGDATYGQLFEVLPFDNVLATLRLTGAELREFLRIGTNGGHGIFQVSGLKVVVDMAKDKDVPPEKRDRLISMAKADGTPIDPGATYLVVTTDFLASGGDGLAPLMKPIPPERVRVDYDTIMREAVIRALKKRGLDGPLTPRTDGRLVTLNDTRAQPEH